MTFQAGNTPNTFVGTVPPQQSDYEEAQAKIPTGRSQMQTGVVVAVENPQTQQGTVAQQVQPTIAGNPNAATQYKWW